MRCVARWRLRLPGLRSSSSSPLWGEGRGEGEIPFLFIRRRLPQIQLSVRDVLVNPLQLFFRKAQVVQRLTEKMLTEENLNSLHLLNEMARARGQTMAQMALSWLLKDNRVTSVLIGASRPEQLEENVQALNNLQFTPEELAQIDRHVADGELNLWQASSDK